MKFYFIYIIMFFFTFSILAQNKPKGITEKTYYDYEKTKLKEVTTRFPDGSGFGKGYFETGQLRFDVKVVPGDEGPIISSCKTYSEFGYILFSFECNNNNNYHGDVKVFEYDKNLNNSYCKYFAKYQDGKLIRFKSMYTPKIIHESYAKGVYNEFEESKPFRSKLTIAYDTINEFLKSILLIDNSDDYNGTLRVHFENGHTVKSFEYSKAGDLFTIVGEKDSLGLLISEMDSSFNCTYKAIYFQKSFDYVKPKMEVIKNYDGYYTELKYITPSDINYQTFRSYLFNYNNINKIISGSSKFIFE